MNIFNTYRPYGVGSFGTISPKRVLIMSETSHLVLLLTFCDIVGTVKLLNILIEIVDNASVGRKTCKTSVKIYLIIFLGKLNYWLQLLCKLH